MIKESSKESFKHLTSKYSVRSFEKDFRRIPFQLLITNERL